MRRDLRRHPVGLGLRPARRRAQGEHQAPVVALDGAARATTWSASTPASSCRARRGRPAATSTTFTDPLTECQSCHKRFRADHLQEEYAEKKGIDDPDTVDLDDAGLPQLRHPRRLDRAAPVLQPAQDLPRRHRGRVRAALPAPRDRAGHLPQLRQRRDQLAARSRRSASPRSARASATRSRPATSSSAPASSSRWRWSSSSSRARTRSGTSTGSTSAPAGTSTSASTPTTCATTSTRRRSSATTPSGPSTSSTASASPGAEWGELEGIANRTDFDLQTSTASTPARTCPTSTRPPTSATCPTSSSRRPASSRSLMTFLVDAYTEDEAPNTKGGVDKRIVLQLDPRLAPVKVAVLPLSRNADLSPKAATSPPSCAGSWNVDFDDSGAIGRRYRRQDEIGTPYCVTVDFDTLDDDAVTVRERDTMKQERIAARPASRRTSPSASSAADPSARHNGRVLRTAARSRAAVLLAAATLLAGVLGRRRATPDGGRVRVDQRRRRASASGSESAAPYAPGPRRRRAHRPRAASSRLGEHGHGRLRAAPGRRSACSTSRCSRLEQTPIQEVVRRLAARRQPDRRPTPYFVRATVTQRRRRRTSAGSRIPLYVVDGANTLVEASDVRQRVQAVPEPGRCPTKFSPARRRRSAWSTSCPSRATLTAVSFRPTQDFDPITWTGEVEQPKPPKPDKPAKGEQGRPGRPADRLTVIRASGRRDHNGAA